MNTLITGGCRCGKSAYALGMAQGCRRKVFIATAQAGDEEMRARIRRHRSERGRSWVTLEEPMDLAHALELASAQADIVVVDCVTLWVSNLLCGDGSDAFVLEAVDRLVLSLAQCPCDVALVTNEVGWGGGPDNVLARRFRDLAGMANQRLAAVCGKVVLMASGIPLMLKS